MIRTTLEEHFDRYEALKARHYWQARIPELETELALPDSQVRRLWQAHNRRLWEVNRQRRRDAARHEALSAELDRFPPGPQTDRLRELVLNRYGTTLLNDMRMPWMQPFEDWKAARKAELSAKLLIAKYNYLWACQQESIDEAWWAEVDKHLNTSENQECSSK